MVTWKQFSDEAPRISEIFVRRHAATGNLGMLATLRADGYPRMRSRAPHLRRRAGGRGDAEHHKFDDLGRDPRFCLHTATIEP